MKIYTLPILLLFATSAHAINTYNSNTSTLGLDTVVMLQTATNYTGVITTVSSFDVFSEDLTPPAANEFATYDNYLNIVTIPSITYQDGSQHYHVQAVINSYTPINPGKNAGTVALPCFYFNIDDISKLANINVGMTYTQLSQLMGCPVSSFYSDSNGNLIMEWSAPFAAYDVQAVLSQAANIANATVISASVVPSF